MIWNDDICLHDKKTLKWDNNYINFLHLLELVSLKLRKVTQTKKFSFIWERMITQTRWTLSNDTYLMVLLIIGKIYIWFNIYYVYICDIIMMIYMNLYDKLVVIYCMWIPSILLWPLLGYDKGICSILLWPLLVYDKGISKIILCNIKNEFITKKKYPNFTNG